MIKRILLSILAIVVLIVGGGLGYLYLRKPATAPPSDIKVSMTPERIARGRQLFEGIADCDGCHSQRDFTRFGGPVVPAGRGQGNVMSELVTGLPGTVVAPNITPDPETGLGQWSDGEKIRAIREGIGRDGRALFPMMNYAGFRHMSDEDVQSLVAFLNTLAPVKHAVPPSKLDFPVNLMIKGAPQPVGAVAAPDPSDRLKYGEYLVLVGGCAGCHTRAERGEPVAGMEFAGGEKFEAPAWGTVYSANITPDLETGIGKWGEEFFVKKFHDYREYDQNGPPRISGPEQFTVMPWLAFSRLSREELGAIYTYLRTLKPIRNAVETHPKKA
jgi:mono/diheme cytochrome c family protein